MMKSRKRRATSLCGTAAAGIMCPLRCAASGLPGPERLVGYGFRHWVEGHRSADLGAWDRAWSLYCGMFGPTRARIAVGALSDWVVALERVSSRTIAVESETCAAFCRDECLAISMIAASQHRACPAMRACTFALIESGLVDTSRLDEVAGPAQAFADTLSSLDQVLSKGSILAMTQENKTGDRPSD